MRTRALWRRIRHAVVPLLYPQRCLGCETILAAGQVFCPACRPAVKPIVAPFCQRCGRPSPAGPLPVCPDCFQRQPTFRRAWAWACYDSPGKNAQPLSKAIQRFKYQRRLDSGTALAALAAEHCGLAGGDYDRILPVPLHLSRLRWRGFNQSLVLARAIGRRHTIDVDPSVLERIKPTPPQARLTKRERETNVKGAFAVAAPNRLAGKTLLLVDDVQTSGATVEECARTLYQGGARAVDVFTLARAL